MAALASAIIRAYFSLLESPECRVGFKLAVPEWWELAPPIEAEWEELEEEALVVVEAVMAMGSVMVPHPTP
jgi:hypothetical protein